MSCEKDNDSTMFGGISVICERIFHFPMLQTDCVRNYCIRNTLDTSLISFVVCERGIFTVLHIIREGSVLL